MVKVLLNGCCGKMGSTICSLVSQFPNLEIVAGIDRFPKKCDFKVFNDFSSVDIEYDVLLDFSRAEALNELITLSEKTKKPLILCSTGYTESDLKLINEKSLEFPIFKSDNMSYGVNLVKSLLEKITPLLYENFDIEIIEKHHNQKVDSPSGTALFLGDAIKNSIPKKSEYVHGRVGNKLRDNYEIGVHAVRGGSIVGDHDIIFAGNGEVIEISHKALSRDVFAIGALKACEYMSNVSNSGLYDMSNVLNI